MQKLIPNCLIFAVTVVFMFGETRAEERYRVASGDNLYRIGRKFGISYGEIMKANRLTKTTIYPNQVLIIPSRGTVAAAPVPSPPPPVIRATQVPQTPAAREYAGDGDRIRIPVDTYQGSTVPRDPVKPFVAARKLPSVPPVTSVEDPLGLGYDPGRNQNSPIKATPVEPSVIAHRVPAQSSPSFRPSSSSQGFPRSREVPAVATYPGKPGGDYALDPSHFPMPSFKNPCTPNSTKSRTVSVGRTYTVQSGDSVWSISRKYGVPPLKLRHCNGIMFSKIHPGMCLKIP